MNVTRRTAEGAAMPYQIGGYPHAADLPLVVYEYDAGEHAFAFVAVWSETGERRIWVEQWHELRDRWERIITPDFALEAFGRWADLIGLAAQVGSLPPSPSH